MTLEYKQNSNNNIVFTAFLFVLIIIGVYAPIIFLNQTILINNPIPTEYLFSETKSTLFGITIDYSMQGNYPDIKLASDMIKDGQLPLWNPYAGIGYPLSADTTHHVFSPLNLGFLLPYEFWIIPFLVVLWVAGFSTFLFLRNLGLNKAGSISGGLFYMLSGGLVWYLPNPNPFVMFVTPLLLLSIDKILSSKNPKYIVLLSTAFGLSVLGGHIQSLILQFVLITTYFSYRILSLSLTSSTNEKNIIFLKKRFQNIGKSIFKLVLGIVGGLSLTAFFILPVFEYLQNGILERDASYGSIVYNPISLLSGFVPYILGPLHSYWTTNVEDISLFGYSGIFALFFSILGLLVSLKNKTDVNRFTPLFFLLVSGLSLMRLANIPIISWFGELPVFNVMYFGNYAGVLIPFGFAIAASYGINSLTQNISKKTISYALFFSVLVIGILLIPVLSELTINQNFPTYVNENDAKNYVLFQIIQLLFFLGIAAVFIFIISKKPKFLYAIIPLILLELSLYVPFGLHPVWMAYKFVIVSILMLSLILGLRFYFNSNDQKPFKIFIPCMLIVFFIGSILLSYYSPYGMPSNNDPFIENPISSFLENNLNHQRYFSFEHTMGPDYSAAYGISSIGKLSSFNVGNFFNFVPKFLDEDAVPGRLGAPHWSGTYGPTESITKFFEHKKYFDFLGIKYIITKGYDLNSFSIGVPGISGKFFKLTSTSNEFYQSFDSPMNSIESLGVGLGATLFEQNDSAVLTINSVPYDDSFHRTSSINNIKNGKINNFYFEPPITNVLNKTFQFTLHYPETSPEKFVVLYYDTKENIDTDNVVFHSESIQNDIFIPFTITPVEKKFPVSYNFHDVYVNENLDALPRAYLVHNIIAVPSNQSQDYLYEHPEIDLSTHVVLEEPLPEYLNNFTSTSTVLNNSEIIKFDETMIKIKTNSNHDGFLILTDAYYPGWAAYVDGVSTEIFKANGIVRAVFVPSGEHVVEFEYNSKSFTYGVFISLFTSILLSGVYVYSIKRKR